MDRERVGAIVFERPGELAWLESVLHPLVGDRVAEWRQSLPADTALAVVEVPLLFETGMEGAFDATVCVTADDSTRAARAGDRGTELLEGRSGRQLSQEEKAARATHVLTNDGSLAELEEQVATTDDDRWRLWPRGRREPRADSGPAPAGPEPARRRGPGPGAAGGWRSLAAAAIGAGAAIGISRIDLEKAIREVTLPLRHDDIIRQQAADEAA